MKKRLTALAEFLTVIAMFGCFWVALVIGGAQ